MLWPLLCLLEWLQNKLDILSYIYLLSGYDSPYCHYKKKLLLYHQGFSLYLKVSGISVCWHIRLLSDILSRRYFSMPIYHGKSKISVCRYIMAWEKFQYAGISWHEKSFSMPAYHGKSKISVCRHIMARVRFQYADISWHEQNFSMPTYHGIDQNP
jgi:hypothetical protein